MAPEPGRTPEVCLLLRVGASGTTPWSRGAGLGLAEHQGAPPKQQEPRRHPGGQWGGAWGSCSVDCFLACNFFFKVLIFVGFFFTNRNTSLFHFYFLFHVIVLSFSF